MLLEEQHYNEAIKYMALLLDKALSEAEKKIGRDLIAVHRKKMGTGAAVGNVPDETTAKTEDAREIPDDNDPVESRIIPQEKYITPIEIQIDSLLSMMTVDTLTDA